MNVNFVLRNTALDEAFLEACKAAGIEGIKGHRSVGGYRASLYNALEEKSIDVLVEVMREFERTH
jgi:phosphoserine aminotransferase